MSFASHFKKFAADHTMILRTNFSLQKIIGYERLNERDILNLLDVSNYVADSIS